MKKYFVLMIMLTMISQLFSYSLLDTFTGSYVNNLDARSGAMGGAGVSGGNRLFDVNLNPANLSFLPVGIGLQTGISVVKNDDNRSVPMYNFFDGYIDDATYVSNTNFYDDYSAGAYYSDTCGIHTFSFGFFYLPYMNFESNYVEEIRNDEGSDFDAYPPIIAKNYLESSGGIYEKKFVTSFNANNNIAIGVGLSHLCGKSEYERRIIWTDEAREIMVDELNSHEDWVASPSDYDLLPDSEITMNREFSGFKFDIGTTIRLSSRVGFGFNYTPKVELNASADVAGNAVSVDFAAPSRTRIGASFEPRNIMKTHFNIDAEYISWAEIDEHYEDIMNFYLGVEHQFKNSLPIRLGFNYQTDYQIIDDSGIVFAEKILMPTFTAGTGFTVLKNIIIDLSGEFSNRKYEALDLFMDGYYNDNNYHHLIDNWGDQEHFLWGNIAPEDRGWENPDLVEETFFKFKVGISYKW